MKSRCNAASHLDRINQDRAYPRDDHRLARPAIVRSTEPLHHGHAGSRPTHWARQAGASKPPRASPWRFRHSAARCGCAASSRPSSCHLLGRGPAGFRSPATTRRHLRVPHTRSACARADRYSTEFLSNRGEARWQERATRPLASRASIRVGSGACPHSRSIRRRRAGSPAQARSKKGARSGGVPSPGFR